jgi:hypothetical protein
VLQVGFTHRGGMLCEKPAQSHATQTRPTAARRGCELRPDERPASNKISRGGRSAARGFRS